MACLLCLEDPVLATDAIDIDSDQAQLQKVQPILQKYFQDELNAALTHTLCAQCWSAVYTFHEFCLRVQQAHNSLLQSAQKADKAKEVTDRIKVEDKEEEVKLVPPAPIKRRRGRPRRVAAKSERPKTPELVEADSVPADTAADDFSSQIDVKLEVLQEEPMDLEYMESAQFSSDELGDCEPLIKLKKQPLKTPKNSTEKQPLKTPKNSTEKQQQTEFIAANFKLSCCLCDMPMENFRKLVTHFRIKHQRPGYALCCDKKFFKPILLVDHIRGHQDPSYFKCKQCGKVLGNKHGLQMHLKTHEAVEPVLECTQCGRKFAHRLRFERHKATHVPQEQRIHACTQCDKTFPDNFTLTQHMRNVHLKLYVKICDICGKTLRTREALQQHMDEHAGIKRQPIECDVCGHTFKSKYMLKTHFRRMHTAENQRPQTCEICNKVSQSVNAHYRHMRYMHIVERTNVCTICNKAFKRLTELKKHMLRHTGGKTYSCSFCGKTFNSSAPMYAHRIKMHPVEYEELCQQRELELQKKRQIVNK